MSDEAASRMPPVEAVRPSAEAFKPAGFWRRFLAWAVDMLILAVPGYFLGGLFYDHLVRIGPYGRFFGLVVMVAYFGLLNSGLGGGQTVGKRLFDIGVLGLDGRPISPMSSFLRASLLALPYILNGWALPAFSRYLVAAWFQGIVVFGLGGSIVYMFVFNRRTRQGFHDILCRSSVGRLSAPTLPVPALPRIHLVMPVLFLALSVASPALAPISPARWFGIDMAPLEDLHRRLSDEPDVFSVGVDHNVVSGPETTRQILTVQAWYVGAPAPEDRQAIMERLGELVVSQYKRIDEVTDVAIVISTAFDLGIASWTRSYRDMRATDKWGKPMGPNSTQARLASRRFPHLACVARSSGQGRFLRLVVGG